MIFSKYRTHIVAISFLLLSVLTPLSPALSQDQVDIIPASSAEENGFQYNSDAHTHPALKLTPDKSELVRLDKPAGSIIIGNPNHLNILADTSKTLVLVPRAPGATHFTVLGMDGNVLMQRHVIVGSPKEKYMRVRRSCAGSGDDNCQQTSVFYCPDMCHEIIMSGESSDSNSSELEDAGNPQNGGDGNADALVSPPDPNTEQ